MSNIKNNLFIFEGINGCGKSTQIDLLYDAFKKEFKFKIFNEPSDSILGKVIRNEYLTGKSEADKFLMANLFMVDRYSQIINEVIDSINEGYNILQSRSFISSMALEYAKSGDKDDIERIFEINEECIKRYYENSIKPHIIFIDVDPEICIKRQKEMHNIADIHESEEFMRKQRQAFLTVLSYLELKTENLFNIHIIDGNNPKTDVFNSIHDYILLNYIINFK